MDARSRRHIQMGTSVRDYGRARPDSDAGYNVSLTQLQQLVTRAQQAATAQREAQVDTRTSSAQKKDLRWAMLTGPTARGRRWPCHPTDIGRAPGGVVD